MHKLIRFYYQNRLKVWAIILAIIFVISIIQVMNNFASKKLEEQNEEYSQETTSKNVVSYDKESEAIISGDKVPSQYRKDFGELIDQFFTYCIEHQPQLAYNLLSKETKEVLYPTEQLFEDLYYSEKFEGDKQFSFNSWLIRGRLYIYQVKIFDNMLTTGKSDDTYYQDFVTICPEEGEYKLNINSLIGIKNINQEYNNDFLSIKVIKSNVFMDYENYTFDIKNKSEKTLKLDSGKDTDNVYLVDKGGIRYSALLYENAEEDLIINPNETKRINIKFSDAYQEGIVIKKIVFEDIVTNYEEYKDGEESKTEKFEIKF